MTFSRFLDVAYALLHDDYSRLDDTIPMATERLSQWALPVKEETKAPVPSANDQALAMLKSRMSGVQGKPKMA